MCALWERLDTTNANFSWRLTQEFFKVKLYSVYFEEPHITARLGLAAGQLVRMAPFFPCSRIVTFLNWYVSCHRIPCPAYCLLCWYTGTSRGDFSPVIRSVTRQDWFCKYKRLPKWWRIPVSYACKNTKGGQERERTKHYVPDKRAGNLN